MAKLNMGTTKKREELLAIRYKAKRHLREIDRVQSSRQPWIPAIADVMASALCAVVKECDERLRLMDLDCIPLGNRCVIQLAFDFLFECTIDEEEIPF